MSIMTKNKQYGCTDTNSQKIEDDKFDIKSYIHGLRDFIVLCNTPMTIAIQGDWGTGKTSIMEMVISDINSSIENTKGTIIPIRFNTWEYSQFNLSSQLSSIMIEALISEIKQTIEKTNPNKEVIESIAKSTEKIRKFLSVVATASLSIATRGMVQLDANNINDLMPTESNKGVNELKNQFNNIVSIATEEGKKRLVVFIDDLDRLDPARAVEILEILKIFLESDNCVFVLAIDYAVVQRGVKAKYGSDFDDEKGKNFFDKIIQVPFQVPVGDYNLKSFIEACIDDTRSGEGLKKHSDKLIPLIETSIGKNPRAIKRVFNALLLLRMVDKNKNDNKNIFDDEDKTLLLFAMLCLQQSCPPIYDFFVMNKESLDGDKLNILKSNDLQKINNELEIEIKQEDLERIKKFIVELYNLIDKDKSGEISDDKEIPVLQEILTLSAVTGNSGNKTGYGSKEISEEEFYETCVYDENTPVQFPEFIKIMKEECPEGSVHIKRYNSESFGVTADLNKYGTTFCEVNERAKGVAAHFKVPSPRLFNSAPDEIKDRINAEKKPNEKSIMLNLYAKKDEMVCTEDLECFRKMFRFCYDETRKKKK